MLVRFEDSNGNPVYVDLDRGAMLTDAGAGRTMIRTAAGPVMVDEDVDSVAVALGYTGSVAKSTPVASAVLSHLTQERGQ